MNPDSPTAPLAIIIPAFKPDFLAQALQCLVRQTDQRFQLYVFDDASPADLQGIVRSVLPTRPVTFHRFEKNLGGESIARHWDRCVAQTSEPWLWIFSDDDLLDDHCVAAFHKFLATAGETTDIVRFDARIVDEADRLVGLHPRHMTGETGLEFTYGRLMGWRLTFMQQLVFRRSAYAQAGGFLDLPLGWHTDDACVIGLGWQRPIGHIPEARIYWRRSGKNLTPDRSFKLRREKVRAVCLFLKWLHKKLQAPRETLFPQDQAAFVGAMDRFLVEQITIQGAFPMLANWKLLAQTRREVCQSSPFVLLKYLALAAVADSMAAAGVLAKKLTGR
jgi:glycosyltransferase involved in cell wall biosynthesis